MANRDHTLKGTPARQKQESGRQSRPRGARVDSRVARQMRAALSVPLLDPKLHDLLMDTDSMALRQIAAAVLAYKKNAPEPVTLRKPRVVIAEALQSFSR